MKGTTVRIAIFLGTVLVVGALAFAVAEGALAPHASQIPVVVTRRSTSSGDVAAILTTSAPVSQAGTQAPSASSPAPTKAVASAHASTRSTAKVSSSKSTDSDRVVVTPAVRDDGDGDEGVGSKSDGDNDEKSAPRSASSKHGTAKTTQSVSRASAVSFQAQATLANTHRRKEAVPTRTASGKN